MVFVSILTFSTPGVSKMLKYITSEFKISHIFRMTYLISGWKHAIDSILVLILTFLMSRISDNLRLVTRP